MYKIKLLDKISNVGLDKFDKNYTYAKDLENEDAVIVRSANLHEYKINENLKAIARAGAGVNNIPLDKCAAAGVVVFNTPGANANAVKELVLCGLLISSRKIVEAVDWAKDLDPEDDPAKKCEKGKKQFVGPEIAGKKLGVIGLGAIGIKVANAATDLEMDVYGYDPYISVKNAWSLNKQINPVTTVEEIYKNCDYISIHIPAIETTKGFLNKEAFDQMKDGVKVINFARGALVNNVDMAQALESGKVGKYVSDFVAGELMGKENVIFIPHLGASTYESEENCASMAVDQLTDFLENGNIVNSVNFPRCVQARESKERICIINENIPNILASISTMFAQLGLNIENMVNRAKGDYAYTLIDTNDDVDEIMLKKISDIEGIIKVREIK
jgi:D-3-phosphoglycerate dehydrogenase